MQLIDCAPEQRRLVRRLVSITRLTAAEQRTMLDLPMTVRCYSKGQDIYRDGDRLSACCLILDGFGNGYKLLPDGRRQITAFHVPGDMPNLQTLYGAAMDHSMAAMMPTRVALIQHRSLRDLMGHHHGLLHALWCSSLIDAAIAREWMTGLGQRSALERVAHLLCEMLMRLEAIGLASGQSFILPVTQAELGDTLGLSTVHVNRTVQELRRRGLITWAGALVTVLARDELQVVGTFNAAYLQQNQIKQDDPRCAA